MAGSIQSSEPAVLLSQYKPENFAEIIAELAGDKPNLKVEVQELKFSLGKTKYEINGQVNFLIHKKPPTQAHKEG